MAKISKKIKERIEKSSKSYRRKNVATISILVGGAVILCAFLGFMQNYSAEQSQKRSSQKILDEVTETMEINDKAVKSITWEFNDLNQSTLQTLGTYITTEFNSFFGENAVSKPGKDPQIEMSKSFTVLAEEIDSDGVFVINKTGDIILSSEKELINQKITAVFGDGCIERFTAYTIDQTSGEVTVNGTVSYRGEKVFSPIEHKTEDGRFFGYSTFFSQSNGVDYFLINRVESALLDTELSSIKEISSVLDGITVGKTGFLFAVDSETKKFSYFDDGKNKLTGTEYQSAGLSDSAVRDSYVGYQTIKGTRYFCLSQKYSSETFGEFTVIAAVVAADEIVSKIAMTVGISCFAFVIVAAIVIGYGMIIRRDIGDHSIRLENQYTNDIKEENLDNKIRFTDEEIQERVKIKIDDSIERKQDIQLRRVNIGTRNAKGVQSYFSTYVAKKIAPVIVVGSVIIFGISFFSQTLMSYQEAITVSATRITDVQQIIRNNEETDTSIREYISDQYLSKSKLISYMIESSPERVLMYNENDYEVYGKALYADESDEVKATISEEDYILENYEKYSKNVHPVVIRNEKGERDYAKDDYGNVIYSVGRSEMLEKVCELNNLKSISIYNDQGYVIATNTDYWYETITNDPSSRLYPLNDIIDSKTNFVVEDVDFGEDETASKQFIAYVQYYYTYQASDGRTAFASQAEYKNQTAANPITRHRSVVQIEIGIDDFRELFEVTRIGYVLNNMHVSGDDSFFIAFDSSDEHRCVYSPVPTSIGKTAADLGLDSKMFKLAGTFNGFITVNGVEYYQSLSLIGDYYFGATIPTSSINSSRNQNSLYTLLFSVVFILIASSFYTISSDKADKEYVDFLKGKQIKEDTEKNSFFIKTASGTTKTSSASSRFKKILWRNKTVEQKLNAILMGYLFAASLVIGIMLLNAIITRDQDSIFTYIFSGEWDRGLNIFSITAAMMVIVLIIAASNLIRVLVKSFCSSLGARVETLGNLFISIAKYGGTIGGVFYCLYLFGFDTTSLLTSAGILTIVVGLGSQSLISDILAGMFIVFEGEFRVGDIVTIGDFRGQVLEIGLRTTKLMDISNNIKIFNNASISGVLNMTKESSFAFVTVGVEYGESLERVEAVLAKGFPEIKKKLPAIVEGPFYKGVLELNTSSVDLGIVAKCAEEDRVQLARDLNREIFILFGKNNINIPFPQVTVSYLDEKERQDATKSEIARSKACLEEGKTIAECEGE